MPGRAEFTALTNAIGYVQPPRQSGALCDPTFDAMAWRDVLAAVATIGARARDLAKMENLGDTNSRAAEPLIALATQYEDLADLAFEEWQEGPEGEVPYTERMAQITTTRDFWLSQLSNFDAAALDAP